MDYTEIYKQAFYTLVKKLPYHDAEDIAQNVILVVMKYAKEIEVHPNPKAWIAKAIYFETMNFYRRKNGYDRKTRTRRKFPLHYVDTYDEIRMKTVPPDTSYDTTEMLDYLSRNLKRTTGMYKMLMLRRNDHSLQDIVKITGKTYEQTRATLTSASYKMKQAAKKLKGANND